jgi:hypothetical protein
MLLSQAVAAADDQGPESTAPFLDVFKRIRVAPLVALQNSSTGHCYSTIVSWNPEYAINEKWGVGYGLGYSLFRRENQDRFSVLEYNLSLSYQIKDSFSLELLTGGQTWLVPKTESGLMLGLNGSYFFPERLLGFIDHAFLGFSEVFQSARVSVIRLGVGMKF